MRFAQTWPSECPLWRESCTNLTTLHERTVDISSWESDSSRAVIGCQWKGTSILISHTLRRRFLCYYVQAKIFGAWKMWVGCSYGNFSSINPLLSNLKEWEQVIYFGSRSSASVCIFVMVQKTTRSLLVNNHNYHLSEQHDSWIHITYAFFLLYLWFNFWNSGK